VTSAVQRLAGLRAVLFDLDGVLTPTAEVHMRAWSRMFTGFLASRAAAPYADADYFAHIDGRPRLDGVRAMLASRGIVLPEGTPGDDPALDTVAGLGNRKNAAFTAELAERGVAPYPGSVRFLDAAVAAGLGVAVVSSSRNADAVLRAAGLRDRFAVVVDGAAAAAAGLAGKPAPDTYLHAARLLGRTAAECAVVEDAHSGVQSGRAGGFGLVVGVDRGAGALELLASGADLVVGDLAELIPGLPVASEERA
jgi:beta-phosphoglucomutase family hydrolase